MADVLSRVETVDNAGGTLATFGANFGKHVISQSDAGREIVISVTRTNANGGLTDAVLTSVRNWITRSHGANGTSTVGDAFTIAAVGTATGAAILNTAAAIAADTATTVVYFRIQGTGSLVVAEADAGVANLAVAQVAVFAPAL
jgi:hypothetical protein